MHGIAWWQWQSEAFGSDWAILYANIFVIIVLWVSLMQYVRIWSVIQKSAGGIWIAAHSSTTRKSLVILSIKGLSHQCTTTQHEVLSKTPLLPELFFLFREEHVCMTNNLGLAAHSGCYWFLCPLQHPNKQSTLPRTTITGVLKSLKLQLFRVRILHMLNLSLCSICGRTELTIWAKSWATMSRVFCWLLPSPITI